ncbi:MAG: IS110 family transposase [Rikenellaceae bacterium]|jgi:transposase|nr:IS110 family transposase [Rikenellaceae bacterium]
MKNKKIFIIGVVVVAANWRRDSNDRHQNVGDLPMEQLVETVKRKLFVACLSSDQLTLQIELFTSIPGVGKVVALAMIIETEAFTKFDNPRSFNCHAGIAPFRYTSGDSIRSKNKVSHRANRDMKRLLHMTAVSVLTKKSSEFREYYDRKVAEGKNKMLVVINALRAKLVARMFAVIKHDKPYMQ